MTNVTQTPAEPREMLTLLRAQRDGYQQLVELGRQQSQLIDEGQSEQLLALLSQRQALIDRLTELGRQVGEYQARWSDLAAALGDAPAAQARELIAEVEQLLAAIIKQDEDDRGRLAASHQQVGRELRSTAAAPRAIGAYKVAAAASPRFTDRQG